MNKESRRQPHSPVKPEAPEAPEIHTLTFTEHDGNIAGGGDPLLATMTVDAAKKPEAPEEPKTLAPIFTKHEGNIAGGGDLLLATMTADAAKKTCAALAGCMGFTYAGKTTEEQPVYVHFK